MWFFLLVLALLSPTRSQGPTTLPQTNLLFIIFDDLRPELKVYGKEHMITPNFDRLAAQSVVFDAAYAQVAVCNPSRDSLLTGLRPDTLTNYGFQTSFKPFLIFPTQLARSGYKTSSFGKTLHWDGNDKETWNTEQYWGAWYDNQNFEWDHIKSTVMPDAEKNLSSYYDYEFTTRAIANVKRLANAKKEFFMTSIGFKLPHTVLHFPHKYLNLYRQRFTSQAFLNESAANNATLFPPDCPAVAFRCCAGDHFKYMNREGAEKATKVDNLRAPNMDLNVPLPARMHQELMWGYSAAISFVDTQLGRLLDAVDELKLWNNLTVVLTADHGMHNGEKGIWEKWTLFDESTRVPLMIYHPLSPYKGKHYTEPVELIDIFPTILDLLNPPYKKDQVYNAPRTRHPRKHVPLAGKSLAPMVLGLEALPILGSIKNHPELAHDYYLAPVDSRHRGRGKRKAAASLAMSAAASAMPLHRHQFAISQIWRCSPKVLTHLDSRNLTQRAIIQQWFRAARREDKLIQFLDCDLRNSSAAIVREEDSFMGYSMRTSQFRYTAWLAFDRITMQPQWEYSALTGANTSVSVLAEELYDHRGEWLARELGTKELINLADDPSFARVRSVHRQRLLTFVQKGILFKQQLPLVPPESWSQRTWNSIISGRFFAH